MYHFKHEEHNNWQSAITTYKNDLLHLESEVAQLQKDKSHFVIIAPVTGTLHNVRSMESGSFLNSGEPVASISPDTDLLVECLIAPRDIGLLKLDHDVNFQIDAYNYKEWGLASGRVIEIGKDIEFVENTSVFKVDCSINEKKLILKSGFEGRLKKGMTLNARFKLAERSLFDLLYDNIHDWLHPGGNAS